MSRSRNERRRYTPVDVEQPAARRGVFLFIGAAWLLVFLAVFYQAKPANRTGPKDPSRVQLLAAAPGTLIDCLSPTHKDFREVKGWKFFTQRFDLIGVSLLVLLSAWAGGRLLLRAMQIGLQLTRTEHLVFSIALGLAAHSLLTLGFGLLGWLNQSLFLSLMLAACAGEVIWMLLRQQSERLTLEEMPNELPRWMIGFSIGLFVAFVAAMYLGSMLPPWEFDVKSYHMAGPKEWHLAGQITFLEHNAYTTFPFLTEMLSLEAMTVRGDWYRGAMAGKAILIIFASLTALALYCAGRRLFSPTVGWVAALVWITTPWAYRISVMGLAEGGTTCFTFLSIFACMLAWRDLDQRLIFLTGLFAGCAMACKYPAAITVVIPIGLGLLVRALKNKPRPIARLVVWYGLGLLITIGPWLLRNLIWTGNPVSPLAWGVFGGTDWNSALHERWQNAHAPDGYSLGMLWKSATLVLVRSDWLSPLLFAFAPLAFLPSTDRDCRESRVLVAAFLLWYLAMWWLFTHRIERFFVPVLPCVAFLSAVGVSRFLQQFAMRIAVGVLLIAISFYNFAFNATAQVSGASEWLLNLEKAPKLGFDTLRDVNAYFADKPDVRVLAVGEAKYFDAKFPMLYHTVFDRSLFVDYVAVRDDGVSEKDWTLRPASEIRSRLKDAGITHLFVNWAEINRYRATYGYSAFVTKERFDTLQKRKVLRLTIEFSPARQVFEVLDD